MTASAKRLATWGRVYDNEDLSRKAKQMEKQVQRLKEVQTEVTSGSQWTLTLQGDALRADRLLEMTNLSVAPAPDADTLFSIAGLRLKSGDRVAIVGRNGCGKSSLLRLIWQQFHWCCTRALRWGITTRRCTNSQITIRYLTRWSRLLRSPISAKWR